YACCGIGPKVDEGVHRRRTPPPGVADGPLLTCSFVIFSQAAMTAMNATQARPSNADGRFRVRSSCLLLLLALAYAACDFGGPPADGRAPQVQILRSGEGASVGNDVLIRISAVPRANGDNFISFVNVTLNSRLLGEAKLVEGTENTYLFRWN